MLQLEDVHGLCDPNPSEYIDMDVTDPNIVFYWGLHPGKTSYPDIDSVEKDFLNNIQNGYQGSPGRMKLSVVPPSEVAKNTQYGTGTEKRRKACWKITDYHPPRVAVYSQHMPHYFIGYLEANGDTKYPSAVG